MPAQSSVITELGDHQHWRAWLPVTALYAGLLTFNLGAWLVALILFHGHPVQQGAAVLAYGLGLRHALDADHIAAIDSATRKLIGEGRRPITTGLFFSLGHSTIVVLLSVLLAATAATIQFRFHALMDVGAIIGTGVSIAFLFVIALINMVVFASVWRTGRAAMAGHPIDEETLEAHLSQRGLLARLFKGAFGLVRRSWHMYPIGFLFGLGFDTATEIGLLGLTASSASRGESAWSILIYPTLFTASMALVDTTDSVLMTSAYRWALKEPRARLTYNLVITGLSILVAVAIAAIEALDLIADRMPHASWPLLGTLVGLLGMSGYGIVGAFTVCWLGFYLHVRLRRIAGSSTDIAI